MNHWRGIVGGPITISAYSKIELENRIADNVKRGYTLKESKQEVQHVGRATRRVHLALMIKEDKNV